MAESIVTAFSSGTLSPSVFGRTDLQQYQQGAADLTNMIVTPTGSARKRPGTKHIATLTNTTEITDFGRLGAFQKTAETAEAILITEKMIRSYKSDGTAGSLNPAPTITAPPISVTSGLVKEIKSVQSKFDILYVGRDFPPYIITNTAGTLSGPTAVTIEGPQTGITLATSADNRPGSVSIVDERVVFGGTNNEPNAIFGSAIKALDFYIGGDEWLKSIGGTGGDGPFTVAVVDSSTGNAGEIGIGDFYPVSAGAVVVYDRTGTAQGSRTVTTDTDLNLFSNFSNASDDAPYAFALLDAAFIDIYWIASTNTVQNGFLIAGTNEGLYAIIGNTPSGAITPGASVSVRRMSSVGCSDIQGVVVDNYLVWVDSSKRKLRVSVFNFEGENFNNPRINDFAEHLFDADIQEVHYQRAPNSILWVLLENGKVLTFSYDPSGNVAAWSAQDFGGDAIVKSMTILHEGREDVPMFLMYHNSQNKYTIERLMPFIETNQDEYHFVDSGVRQYNATAFTTVTGLSHLEGETVKVWADGAAHPDVVVASGQVTLNREVNTAIVGRGYTATVQTLPVPSEVEKQKRVNKTFIRFLDTIGAKTGEEFIEIVPFMQGNFVMGAKPEPFTGLKEAPYRGRYGQEAQITVYSDSPTPFHVLSVITRLEIYG